MSSLAPGGFGHKFGLLTHNTFYDPYLPELAGKAET
jgi:hypothetical protein